jgi:hypothetical protein
MITAKIKCHLKMSGGDGQTQVHFEPDYADGRNAEWAKYTPAMSLSMTMLDEVADRFETGRAYMLQFVESE